MKSERDFNIAFLNLDLRGVIIVGHYKVYCSQTIFWRQSICSPSMLSSIVAIQYFFFWANFVYGIWTHE